MGAPDDMNTLMAMVNNVPSHWHKSAFSIGRRQLEYVAAAALVGANIRVGLEDNLYLSKGVKATNAQLVETRHGDPRRHELQRHGSRRGARHARSQEGRLIPVTGHAFTKEREQW